jgi:hypothetical protein
MSYTIVKTSSSQCHIPSSKQVVHNVIYHCQNKWFTMSYTIVKTSGSQCHIPSSKQAVHNVIYRRQNKWFTISYTIVKTSGSQCHIPSSKPFRIQLLICLGLRNILKFRTVLPIEISGTTASEVRLAPVGMFCNYALTDRSSTHHEEDSLQ